MYILNDAINALDPALDKKTEPTLVLNLINELTGRKETEFRKEATFGYQTTETIDNRTAPITRLEYRAALVGYDILTCKRSVEASWLTFQIEG